MTKRYLKSYLGLLILIATFIIITNTIMRGRMIFIQHVD